MNLELEQAQNEIAALQRRLAEYASEVQRLSDSLIHARQWWAVRFERMNDFAREELPEPLKERYFSIAANGVPSPADPPTYAVQMNELRHEIERLREQGRECYVDADSKSTLNALEECRTERDKLKEVAKQILEALRSTEIRVTDAGYLSDIRDIVQKAFTAARE